MGKLVVFLALLVFITLIECKQFEFYKPEEKNEMGLTASQIRKMFAGGPLPDVGVNTVFKDLATKIKDIVTNSYKNPKPKRERTKPVIYSKEDLERRRNMIKKIKEMKIK
jgi:hypothetical protein